MSRAPLIACFFATSGHSGVDRIAGNLLPAMAARGYRVDLLRIRGHGLYLPEDGPVRIVPIAARHVLTAIPGLIAYLRRQRPDVILTDKDKVNRAMIIARFLAHIDSRLFLRNGTTVSVNLASRDPVSRWTQILSMRYLYRFADALIMPSAGAADDFARFIGFPRQRIRVIDNPVITEELETRARQTEGLHPWLRDKQEPVVVAVGELCARKDFATLIRAMDQVNRQRPCRLLIFGEGRRRQQLAQLASDLHLGDRVALAGFTDNPHNQMRAADLFVLSSRWEGLPTVLIEAMAVGTPVVSTDCPSGPREILRDGELGALVPMNDPEAMAEAMLATLANPMPASKRTSAVARYRVSAAVTGYLQTFGLA